ncbi:sigma-70 family RNA polymerase sigma factor [Streptomyces sp. CHD11]|uniref:sigma-70 family RNA polymerase sigma factor n=1 Tax=Streptomyces sp. CHD11 TaxID=2741325 RepID=UPI001BFC0188|nr:sigma-70 family RNA polymerase sigma factor [Streptomyces sp. CHD11]MBT3149799.1 sigma-70 family RNA polymerase sigma factor [Streptomyces sp. CHD11]
MRAQDELVAAYLPLVYNIVGRALNGHPDVDDVVQETMLRALAALGSLKDPDGFRSWLVAITMNQLRHHWRDHRTAPARSALHDAYEVADPGADFVDLTIVRLGLEGQRREAAEATRWLDPDDQALLSLWWLEAAGELSRAEVAAALELSPQHTAVRVQRMKAQLETARLVVRALAAHPRCVLLDDVVAPWDAVPGALWRKRIARHVRDCTVCAGFESGLVPAEGLLVGLGLVPVGASLLAASALFTVFGSGTADAAPVSFAGEPTGPGAGAGTDGWGSAPAPGGAPGGRSGTWGDPDRAGSGSHDRAAGHGDGIGGPARAADSPAGTADSPTGSPEADAVVGHRTNLRARSRQRRRRGRTVAAVAAALLVTGGVISGIAVLTPDGDADRVRAASESGPESGVPTPGAATPSAEASSPSPSASASPSARETSRKPTTSATPRPEKSEAKSAPARTTAPAKPPAQPKPEQPDEPAAPPAQGAAAQVLSLTNTERSKAGCGPVKLDDRLARAAQLHSEDMSANGYFSHTGQNGSSFVDRAKAQGHPSPGAENIAQGQSSAASVMDAWMNSEGHRANILNCSLKSLGVGVTQNDWTWTQVFGF